MSNGKALLDPVTMRFDQETLTLIDDLAKRLAARVGLTRPLSRSDVVRAALRRLAESESKKSGDRA